MTSRENNSTESAVVYCCLLSQKAQGKEMAMVKKEVLQLMTEHAGAAFEKRALDERLAVVQRRMDQIVDHSEDVSAPGLWKEKRKSQKRNTVDLNDHIPTTVKFLSTTYCIRNTTVKNWKQQRPFHSFAMEPDARVVAEVKL